MKRNSGRAPACECGAPGNDNGGYGGLNLNQEFTIGQCSFEDMAKIMKRFHDLMEEVKKYK